MASTKRSPLACPDPLHEHSTVVRYGTVMRKAGKVLRFRCTPLTGERHYFSVGTAGGRRVRAQRGAPGCPDHPNAIVKRHGSYGPAKHRRQRYICAHLTCGSSCATRWRSRHTACPGWHTFTPALPRHHVSPGDQCGECLELRGIHRGETMAARRRRLSARQVARLLSEMSGGMSYSRAGKMALDYAGIAVQSGVLRRKAKPRKATVVLVPGASAVAEAPHPPIARRKRSRSPSSRLSARLWHVGADLVEAFAPVVWDDLDARLRAHAETIAAAGHTQVKPLRLLEARRRRQCQRGPG
jgi:hypothetical protein